MIERENMRFFKFSHKWNKRKCSKCEYCGVNKNIYQRDEGYEAYAFSFIHKKDPNEFLR